MSARKYRLYLLIIALVAIITGAMIYIYNGKQEKAYRDGTLVQTGYVVEEALV